MNVETNNKTSSHTSLTKLDATFRTSSTIVADTAATVNYIMIDTPCSNVRPTTTPLQLYLADSSHIQSTHKGILDLPMLPPAARTAHLLPDLKPNALLSIGQLCNNGCTTEFTATDVIIKYNNTPILQGFRDPIGLWQIPMQHKQDVEQSPQTASLPQPQFLSTASSLHTVNSLIDAKTQHELIQYIHATCFSPTESTWVEAIKNNHFTTWPLINDTSIHKYFRNSTATAKCHLDQQRQNIRSTKQPTMIDDEYTIVNTPNHRTNFVYATIGVLTTPTGQVYTDQAGRFPVLDSNEGHKYIMILYDYDSNAILTTSLKNRRGPTIKAGYEQLHRLLVQKGYRPKLQKLDNEASQLLKDFLMQEDIDFQLTPPGMHRRNTAERAIRTFKNHLIAGFATTDKQFPMKLWAYIVEQAQITLNLLRKSRLHPQLSAYAALFGQFDFNKTPMAPPGTKVIVHEKPKNRGTWAPHGVDGWYVGPAMEHYRCYKCYIPATDSIRIADTVQFFPTTVPFPKLSSADNAFRAASELIDALKHPHPAQPFAPIGTSQTKALQQLADIFAQSLPQDVRTATKSKQNKPISTPI
jgi:hypothetical protein